MKENIEKMGFPVYDEREGETFDASVLYQGIHIKEKFLKQYAQKPEEMIDSFKNRIEEHLKICPRNESTGRPSCQEKSEEYKLKQGSLLEEKAA